MAKLIKLSILWGASLVASSGWLAAQTVAPVPSPLQVVSYCGSRPDVTTTSAQNVFVFDSGYTSGCSFKVKSVLDSGGNQMLLWNIYVTNGNTPTNTSDAGVSKQDVTTPARAINGGPIDNDANCGNPIISPNGLYILFECQNSTNITQDVDPGTGAPGYSLYGCKTIPCTNTSVGLIYSQATVRALCTATPSACATVTGYDWTTMTMGGGLDPHFYPWDDNTAYWSVMEASGATNAWGTIPQFWSEHVFTIDWSGAAPVLSGTVGRWIPGNWPTFAGSRANQCTRYYKASGVSRDDRTGVVTMYTQADQVPGFSFSSAPPGCIGTNCTDQCYWINGTYRQSGLFSFTLDNAPAGSNWTQLAPIPGQTPKLISGEYYPYYEFPLLLYGIDPTAQRSASTKMIVISNALSGQFGLFSTLGFPSPENESNKHDDYYLLDIETHKLSLITNADVPGTAWHTALAAGGLSAMAHAGYNPYGRFMVTRLVSAGGTADRVIRIPLDYPGNGVLNRSKTVGKMKGSGKTVTP